jgi:hypothetical protein
MPTITETPILGSAFRKAREAMQGGDAPKRLSDALTQIAKLKARLAEIESEVRKHGARFSDYASQCRAKFERDKTFESELTLTLAEVALNWHQEHSTSPAERAIMALGYGNAVDQTSEGRAFAKFASEITGWREPLETALKAKAEIAEQSHQEILATVREQLGGFGDDSVMNDPRVKQARKESVRWGQLAQRFTNEKDLAAWQLGLNALK